MKLVNNHNDTPLLRQSADQASSCLLSPSDHSSADLASFMVLSAFRLGGPVLKLGYRRVLRSDSTWSLSSSFSSDDKLPKPRKSALKKQTSTQSVKKSVVFSAAASSVHQLAFEEFTHSDVWWTEEDQQQRHAEWKRTMRRLRRHPECMALVDRLIRAPSPCQATLQKLHTQFPEAVGLETQLFQEYQQRLYMHSMLVLDAAEEIRKLEDYEEGAEILRRCSCESSHALEKIAKKFQ